ncbi:LacI family DNA-binding transcriptional regulator [Maribacter sp. 2307ULW6-5]|uniref:LacI family DNA-binding transcriptional regulator n=1 Tax=Maribacter sp. 2307ULW6-5 TaxID=3386275 RepID=UPI0039BCAF7E
MKPKMTLKKIATELGVSISTVSKALHNNPEISQENRDKIQAFAKLYNYRPNSIALSLKNKQSNTIGVIIPELVHNFFAEVLSGVEQVANERGYNVIIGVSNESFHKEVMNMDLLVNGSIDGFILSVSKETMALADFHHLNEVISQGVPITMFDRVVREVLCDKVVIDDYGAAKDAVKKLLDGGSKKILLLSTEDYLNVGRLRSQGYADCLAAHGMPLDEELMLKVDDKGGFEAPRPDLEKAIRQKFQEQPQIDGVFAVNELYAITAIKVALELGLKVPQDVAVVCFSNGVMSKYHRPSLTTIDQHGVEMGKMAAATLIDRLEAEGDPMPYRTKVVPTTLMERESTP